MAYAKMGLLKQSTFQVQLAVVETGLGGVADATNVFAPANLACAIITAIDKDHLKALGRPIRVMQHDMSTLQGCTGRGRNQLSCIHIQHLKHSSQKDIMRTS